MKDNQGFIFYFRYVFILLAVLLIASLFRVVFSGQVLTFSAFLELISTSNGLMFQSALTDFTIYGNWGIFDGFRNFLNIFTGLFSIIVFIGSNLISALVFIFNFVRFLILG